MKVNYKDANEMLYRRRKVFYSWKRNDLLEMSEILKKLGFKFEYLNREKWDKIAFIRDGSFLILENTLMIKRREKKKEVNIGYITSTKLVIYPKYEQKLRILKQYYKRKIGLFSLSLILFSVFLILFYLVFSKKSIIYLIKEGVKWIKYMLLKK